MKAEVTLLRLGAVQCGEADCVLKLARPVSEPLSLIGVPTLVANSMRSSVFSNTLIGPMQHAKGAVEFSVPPQGAIVLPELVQTCNQTRRLWPPAAIGSIG